MSRSRHRARRGATSAAAVVLVALTALGTAAAPASAATASGATASTVTAESDGPSETTVVQVPDAPGSTDTIGIDTDLYLPATSDPAPAVLLAHGFGGSKESLAGDAERLRDEGFVVLAYTARGFGDSGGRIALDSIDYEVADAVRMLDLLDSRREVEHREGDPVVGVAGGSYGGALALMLGATDPRVDTVVASITWNDLAQALVPQTAEPTDGSPAAVGVFKQAWASQLFGDAASSRAGACGRFTAELCTLYTKLIGGGQLDDSDRALLAASSPASVLDRMTAPTLLLQGREDTLFGLDQADANARQIAAAGAEVRVEWFAGGHDGGLTRGTTDTVDAWLTTHLMGRTHAGASTDPFSYYVPASARGFAETRVAASYPAIGVTTEIVTEELRLRGRPEVIVNPPGGLPAIITSLPGTGSLDTFIDGVPSATGTPGQQAQRARFGTEPITKPFVLAGSPTVTVDVALPRDQNGRTRQTEPSGQTDQVDQTDQAGQTDVPGQTDKTDQTATSADPIEVELFAQLRVASGDTNTAVGGGVAPFRVAVPADGSVTRVRVTLPATTWRFEEGDRIRVSIRTTDAGYQGSAAAASIFVDLDGDISLPTVTSSDPAEAGGSASMTALVGIPIVLAIGLILGLLLLRIGRRRDRLPPPTVTTEDAPPLVIRGLTKDYRAGFRAVDDLTFTVRRGQVLGLLGPNGAGKTTALRMVTGLLRPDAGEIEIFGERVVPGSRVLTRVGCFIEGPGFLPHLSGRRNLQLYWAASGRPTADARLDEALGIADLGAAVDRRVGGYSQGMRQRLAIAQAMLGMPELLILDEPTNGLDPPQIFALRGVLRRYAETGRTVIVSSHLLGEVEQTCSDVVVMARGRLLAAGTVAELAGETNELTIEVTDVAAAVSAMERLGGVVSAPLGDDTVRVLPGEHSPESIVTALGVAGIGIRSLTRGRHLEETFLAMVGSEGIG